VLLARLGVTQPQGLGAPSDLSEPAAPISTCCSSSGEDDDDDEVSEHISDDGNDELMSPASRVLFLKRLRDYVATAGSWDIGSY
jgi:hypothetical protein